MMGENAGEHFGLLKNSDTFAWAQDPEILLVVLTYYLFATFSRVLLILYQSFDMKFHKSIRKSD
jgi:hypothetical protein